MVLDRGDEPVSPPGEGFNVTGAGGRVSKGLADFVDGRVEAVVEIDEGIGGPEFLLQVFARNDFASALEQQCQNLERLALQAEFHAALTQFTRGEIYNRRVAAPDAGDDSARKHHQAAVDALQTAGLLLIAAMLLILPLVRYCHNIHWSLR